MTVKKVIFATGNEGKMREVRMIMEGTGIEVISMKEAGVKTDAEENGSTFTENAIIKARAVAEKTGEVAMADDSGLVVDALNGEPGIYSARYMGEDTSYRIKNQNIIDRMAGVEGEKRAARFVAAIACVFPDGKVLTTEAAMEGVIGTEERGENGFGYDPILFLPEFGCSSAELTPEQKNEISHRGKALRQMRALLAETENEQ